MRKKIRLLGMNVREAISFIKADGFYKQSGNPRQFLGPNEERITLYNGDYTKSTYPPWGSVDNKCPAVNITITNTPDEDMVEKDLQFLMEGLK